MKTTKIMKKAAIALSIQAALFTSFATFAAEDVVEKKDDSKLEKITVTALKRTQSIQDVPLSIATLSGEKFENILAGGDDILALATRVPGLYAESSNGRAAPRFYMRGLGNTDFDLAASQPVSIIMDEVVMENVVLKSFPLFDMDQVEIIRGPQGSLFGRNTTAGVIKFTSRKPTDDFEAYVKAGVGTYGLVNLEGAVGGGLTDELSARLSVLSQSKDDWIDNGYTGEDNALGGHKDQAFRLQLAYKPTNELDMLFNVHSRSLEGTSSVFRANILTTGSNELNENYDRDTVWFDEGVDASGDNNPQSFDSDGWSLTANYDFGDFTLTSITASESAKGYSLGDIDGGNGCDDSVLWDSCFVPGDSGPGYIPFTSNTQDAADVDQFTQEIRLSSNGDNNYSWQTGVFYFDSELEVATSPFFIPTSTVNQTNTTWAVFGQGTYDVTDMTTIVAGLRYTEDEKGLTGYSSGFDADVTPIDLSDNQVSWELMANHKLDADMSLYARVSNGFRAQSIQGRDVAFFGTPSVAESETIMSYEAGFKSDLFNNTVRLNGAVFHYTIDDIQLTAVGGNGNSIGLTNAGKGVGTGFELDSEIRVTEDFLVTAGFSYNKTELQDKDLLIGICGSGQCTPTDPLSADGTSAYVDGNPFPNAPETIFTLTGRYALPIGDSGEMFVYSDYAYQGETSLFIYQTEEYVTDGQFELGLRIGYVNYDMDYEVALFGRNITDEDNLKAGIDFNNNTGVVNEPAIWGVEFKKTFF
ncbi:TonB-dependent receptor [uncultured Psychrosphaera sp.]|jgi:iron complex outermembrane receptor protein|uniref:TonB-dependent receptor n=1 Tax=uncultured Psychrosphaera sp. TaxID=1403522 RepID=UPI002601A177|nr:TonB-dependent receptor [uncultured Psychrosphaera sp.]